MFNHYFLSCTILPFRLSSIQLKSLWFLCIFFLRLKRSFFMVSFLLCMPYRSFKTATSVFYYWSFSDCYFRREILYINEVKSSFHRPSIAFVDWNFFFHFDVVLFFKVFSVDMPSFSRGLAFKMDTFLLLVLAC